jgi:hypothetical protein
MAGNFPSWRQALVTLVSGVVLAISTCGGMLANFQLESNSRESWFLLFTIGFLLSGLIALAGIVFVIIRFAGDRRARRQPPPQM